VALYEEFPIETDSGALAEDSHAYLSDRWPGYTPSPANFDSGTIDAHALMSAEVRDVAANVPDGIFRRFGDLAGLLPDDAVAATLTATLTAIDNLGYTLDAGTVFGLRATGDIVYLLEVEDAVTIAPGSTTSAVGGVSLTAQEPGAGPNGLGTPGTVLVASDRTLPWLSALTTVTAASGGVDAEDDAAYLDRLTTELRLSAPRPIVAGNLAAYDPTTDDFAEFAKLDPAVARAISADLYVPGTNEVQTISHNGTGGSFTVNVAGSVSGSIAWNATAAAAQTALEAASTVAPGDVIVTGGPVPAAITVEFRRALGEQNVAATTTAVNSLTPATPTITYTTTVGGVAPQTNVGRSVTVWVMGPDGLDPGSTARARVDADLQAKRESNFVINVRAPYYDSVAVTYTAKAYPGWDPADVQARANIAVADWLSPATFGAPPFSEEPIYLPNTAIYLGELVEVLNRVDGLWRVTGPNANGMPSINGAAADYTLVGPGIVLPLPGTISGTVTA
jgi:hypothetical protein